VRTLLNGPRPHPQQDLSHLLAPFPAIRTHDAIWTKEKWRYHITRLAQGPISRFSNSVQNGTREFGVAKKRTSLFIGHIRGASLLVSVPE
jgi:hypothetical protein